MNVLITFPHWHHAGSVAPRPAEFEPEFGAYNGLSKLGVPAGVEPSTDPISEIRTRI